MEESNALLVIYILSVAANLTIFKKTLKDLSKTDPGLNIFFMIIPVLNTLGVIVCIWIYTEDFIKSKRRKVAR